MPDDERIRGEMILNYSEARALIQELHPRERVEAYLQDNEMARSRERCMFC